MCVVSLRRLLYIISRTFRRIHDRIVRQRRIRDAIHLRQTWYELAHNRRIVPRDLFHQRLSDQLRQPVGDIRGQRILKQTLNILLHARLEARIQRRRNIRRMVAIGRQLVRDGIGVFNGCLRFFRFEVLGQSRDVLGPELLEEGVEARGQGWIFENGVEVVDGEETAREGLEIGMRCRGRRGLEIVGAGLV